MQLTYHPYQDSDFPFCNTLIMRNMGGYFADLDIQWNPERYRGFIAEGIAQIVSWGESKIGFYHLTEEADHVYLHNVQLGKDYQGKGIGGQVMEIVEKECQQRGKTTLMLSVFKENPALRLYKRRGFELEKDRGYKVLLKKSL